MYSQDSAERFIPVVARLYDVFPSNIEKTGRIPLLCLPNASRRKNGVAYHVQDRDYGCRHENQQ